MTSGNVAAVTAAVETLVGAPVPQASRLGGGDVAEACAPSRPADDFAHNPDFAPRRRR
jgi:hypothetical protein